MQDYPRGAYLLESWLQALGREGKTHFQKWVTIKASSSFLCLWPCSLSATQVSLQSLLESQLPRLLLLGASRSLTPESAESLGGGGGVVRKGLRMRRPGLVVKWVSELVCEQSLARSLWPSPLVISLRCVDWEATMRSVVPIAAPVTAGSQEEEITALHIPSHPPCPVFPVSGVSCCQAKLHVTSHHMGLQFKSGSRSPLPSPYFIILASCTHYLFRFNTL